MNASYIFFSDPRYTEIYLAKIATDYICRLYVLGAFLVLLLRKWQKQSICSCVDVLIEGFPYTMKLRPILAGGTSCALLEYSPG